MGLLSGFSSFVQHPLQGLLGAFQQPTDGGAYFDENGQLIGNGGDASRPYGGFHPQAQARVAQATPDPYAPSRGQRFGALLKDAGTSLQGGQSDFQGGLEDKNLSEAQKRLAIQKALQQQQALKAFAGLVGGQGGAPQVAPQSQTPFQDILNGAPASAPTRSPGSATGGGLPSLRALAPALVQLQAAGVDTSDLLSILDKSAPDIQLGPDGRPYDKRDPGTMNQRFANRTNINGHVVDLNNPNNENDYFGKLPDNSEPVYDRNGRIVGVKTVDGALNVLGDTAQATAAGTARGQAPYDFVDVPTPNGAPRKVAKSQAAGGDFVGQTPRDAALTTAGTQAQIALPQVVANADQTLTLIKQLKGSSALGQRTGVFGIAPAIPGTEGANFDAMDAQLRGKLFMEAYAGLKGGGQITEVEGKKATDAMARLSRTQKPEAYRAALDDLAGVIQAGRDRAQRQASLGQGASNPGAIPTLADIDAAIARKRKGPR